LVNFRITPFGTCRVHTPLRRSTARYPIEVDARRNYGFVHTSDEALQLVRFLQCEKQFNKEVAPLVARGGNLEQYEAEQWQPSDLHIVEISSSKRITCGSDSVQANYVNHYFADFFASKERSRTFWTLVKRAHRQDLIDYLERQPTFQLLSAGDRELLMRLQMEPQSFKAIKSDMAEIVERLGRDKLLFVTHVNAATPDDELIPARDRLIRWVKMAAEQLDAAVFDPTPVMQDFGQEKALEAGGLDLTHYTPAFYDRVYDEIHRSHVAPLMGVVGPFEGRDGAEDQAAKLAAKLEAMLEIGDFFIASREVHAALEKQPRALPLIELRGLIRSRIGDFSGAVSDLTARGDDSALSQSMRVGLVEALNATGDPAGALRVADNLLGEEYESADMYRAAAEAAERLGRIEQAIAYAKQAFRKDRSDLSAALHALVLLSEKGSSAETAAWRREILENIDRSANGAFEVSMWAIANRDEELFAAALKAVAPLDKAGTVDLFEDAFTAGMYRGVARSIGVAAALGRIPRSMSERRTAVIEGSLERAQTLFEEGYPSEAYEIAQAILVLDDVSNSQIPAQKLANEARRLIKQMSQHVRTTIRAAYKAKDVDEVIRVGEAAGDLLLALPDIAAAFARSLHAAGRTAEAMTLLKQTHAQNRDSFVANRWTARFAAMAADYGLALEIYGALRRSQDPEVRTIESELDRFFSTVEPRAMKQLRRLVMSGEHEQAVRLARLIKQEVGAEERVEREINRLHSLLHRRLKEIEQGIGEPEEREPVLRQIVQVRPTDPVVLRRYALELMRQFRFAEAAEMWGRISTLDPDNEAAARQRERCAKMAQRRITALGGDLDAAA
jgi:tetratricopeptide (TPR) repeat protein